MTETDKTPAAASPATGLNWSPDQDQPVSVTVPDSAALLADLRACLSQKRGFSVATLNLDHVVKLRQDSTFRAAYAAQTHVTADGNPIVWLSHLSGRKDIALVTGSDALRPVVSLAAEMGVPIGLFGSTDASIEGAAHQLQADYPGLDIPFRMAPPMGFDPTGETADAAIEALRDSGAQLVLLALGAPKQEIFAAHALKALPQVGFLSIGAGIDFISGFQQRAPVWARRAKVEWLWRMMQNPGRLAGRYAGCALALPGLAAAALSHRRHNRT